MGTASLAKDPAVTVETPGAAKGPASILEPPGFRAPLPSVASANALAFDGTRVSVRRPGRLQPRPAAGPKGGPASILGTASLAKDPAVTVETPGAAKGPASILEPPGFRAPLPSVASANALAFDGTRVSVRRPGRLQPRPAAGPKGGPASILGTPGLVTGPASILETPSLAPVLFPTDGALHLIVPERSAWLAPQPADAGAVSVSPSQVSWRVDGTRAPSIDLAYEQTSTLNIAGATSAYALDASIVRAAANGGAVTLFGRSAGTTHVVVTVGPRVEFLRLTVGEPPVTILQGFTPSGTVDAEAGTADVRYGSEMGLLQGGMRLLRRQGDRMVDLAVSAATVIAKRDLPAFSLPLASYTTRTPRREVTVMDKVVANSPLTVSRSNLRGLHWKEGPVAFHAGYSFFGTFEQLLLPADRQQVAGISYRQRLSRSTTSRRISTTTAPPTLGRPMG